jgi:hypothetical protein
MQSCSEDCGISFKLEISTPTRYHANNLSSKEILFNDKNRSLTKKCGSLKAKIIIRTIEMTSNTFFRGFQCFCVDKVLLYCFLSVIGWLRQQTMFNFCFWWRGWNGKWYIFRQKVLRYLIWFFIMSSTEKYLDSYLCQQQ